MSSNDSNADDDDDLRSLLSNNSSKSASKKLNHHHHPHRSKLAPRRTMDTRGPNITHLDTSNSNTPSTSSNKKNQQSQQQQQPINSHGSVHSNSETGDSFDSVNLQVVSAGSSDSIGSSHTNNNPYQRSGSHGSQASAMTAAVPLFTPKRLLYLLGTALLASAVLGPTGPFLFLFDHNPSSPPSHGIHNDHGRGDKRHPLHKLHAEYKDVIPQYHKIKAAGSRKHDKFGVRNKKQKTKQQPRGVGNDGEEDYGPIHSNIKEAIDNIDKVFMGQNKKKNLRTNVDEYVDRKSSRQKRKGDVTNNDADDDNFLSSTPSVQSIPIIHADDDTLPENAEALDAYTNSLPASDALECRASVIAFVINATDVRDECEGLRKAFDKTCSVNSHVGESGGGEKGGGAVISGRRRLKSRGWYGAERRLWSTDDLREGWKDKVPSWSSSSDNDNNGTNSNNNNRFENANWSTVSEFGIEWFWRIRLGIQAWQSLLSRYLNGDGNDAFLYAEEEVASERVWKEASYMVEMGLDLQALANDIGINSSHGDRRLNETLDPNLPSDAGESLISKVEERKVEDSTEEEAPAVSKKEDDKPKISLMIPTSDEHVSEQLLNDALMLQEANDESKQSPAESGGTDKENQQQFPSEDESSSPEQSTGGNNTASEEAARDAAESANSIRTATDKVKNMMMDPKSVEARTCCASILSVFHEHCDPTTTGIEDYSDRKLLVIVFVVTVCGIIKSIIRYFNIRWLPEAGGCILVGVMGYLIMQNMSYVQYAFDGDMFLRIMVPPIVFEAAVKINKRSFQRHIIPITIYAILGTLLSTTLTATILYKGSSMVSWCASIPMKESLIFGSLISSIDPIAVLSVLNNMGMTDSDTIYVLIFGESLLNDGIAIVLFQTLVHFLDEALVIDGEAVFDAIIHFVVVALGSLTVGVASGACATIYFAVMHGMQTPMVELISFLAWAFIPYFICDMVEWSGIVAIVANGFVMDLYIVGQRNHVSGSSVDDEIDFLVHGNTNGTSNANGNGNSANNNRGRNNAQQWRAFFNSEGHLSPLANTHVHFVIEIFATLMETAIFAYLGLFLFSPRYHWNKYLTIISIFATVMGRVIMIPMLSHLSNFINRMIISRNNRPPCLPRGDTSENVHVDRRMQTVLVFAGLRGAMSFALVEHIPLYDTITGQGTRLKPELKAMTSASIIFTVFVLGGATSYLMERIGYSISPKQEHDAIEVTPLVRQSKPSTPSGTDNSRRTEIASRHRSTTSNNSVRQRGSSVGTR